MATAIRLSRQGRKKKAFYRVKVTDSRERRDGRGIEDLGYYDPHTDEININMESYEKWISVGAQASDRVKAIVKQANESAK